MKPRLLLIVLLLSLSVAVAAQEPPAAPAAPADTLPQRFSEARKKFEARDFQAVLTLLEPAKDDPTAPPPVFALLGGAYIELGRFQDALTLLDPLASDQAAGPAVLYNAARAALALGQGDKAEGYLKRAVAVAPQSPASRALGLRYGRAGKVAEAWPLLEPWAKAHPEDLDARLAAAFCALELGNVSEAEGFLSGLPQDNPQVRLLWGRLLLAQHDPRAAIERLAPIEVAPPKEIERDFRWALAEARLETGDAAGAVKALEGHTGTDPALALLLAQGYQQTGAPDKVQALLKPFLDPVTNPAAVDVARRPVLAAMALEAGKALVTGARWAEAVKILETSTALDSTNPAAWQALGQALNGAGRRAEAQKALAKFQELSTAAPGPDAATPP